MKGLFFGIVLIITIGFGGLVYRNVLEHPKEKRIACPLDALVCPDGTAISRVGVSCSFPVCPPPNISLPLGVAFAIPAGFVESEHADGESIVSYESSASSSMSRIVLRRYAIAASTTALETIQKSALDGVLNVPINMTLYSSTILGTRRFTIVRIERSNSRLTTAYYFARSSDVLRFDAIDSGVKNWSDARLDISKLLAHAALEKLLATLQER